MNCFIPSPRACCPALIFLVSHPVFSQNSFQKLLGSPKNELANTIIATPGGYVLAGRSFSNTDSTGACLLKTDPDGAVLWQKMYGKFGREEFLSVAEASDGGLLALGWSQSFDFYNDIYMVKTDSAGNPQWQKIITSVLSNTSDYGYKAIPTAGGFICTALTANKSIGGAPVLVRVGNDGETLWSKSYSTGGKSNFRLIDAFLSGDTLFACGFKDSIAAFCLFNAADGSPISGVLLDDPGFTAMKELRYLAPAPDGDLLLAGYITTFDDLANPAHRLWVCRMSRAAELRWSKTYSGVGLGAITPMSDGNFLLSPSSDIVNSEQDPYLVKIDGNGALIWARQYGGPGSDLFASAIETPDGGVFAVGTAPQTGSYLFNILAVKTDPSGRVAGCCQRPVNVEVNPFPTVLSAISLSSMPYYNTKNVMLPVHDDHPNDMPFCPPVPPAVRNVTIDLCPGDTVVIEGKVYSAPGVVSDTLYGPECDTIVVYTLQAGANPVLEKTIEFCPGDTVFLAGVAYTAPATVSLRLPAAGGNCDTLLTCFLAYTVPSGPTSLAVQCPSDILVQAPAGAAAAPVVYDLPAVQSDCPCPGIRLTRTAGLPGGSAFPVGVTPVCFQAQDSCGNTAECCFDVQVVETEAACDVKTAGCLRFELLRITRDAQYRRTYHLRVTNLCNEPLAYAAFQLPAGVAADAPQDAYTAPSGRTYAVRNPNYAPVYSIRFTPQDTGIASGMSEIFRFTLPPQPAPDYLNALAKLAGRPIVEAHLNTFNCPVSLEPPGSKPAAGRSGGATGSGPALRLFPNPAHGVLFAGLKPWAGQAMQLRIFNAQGQLALSVLRVAGEEPLRLELPPGLPDGLYLLEAIPAYGERQVGRFLVR